LPAVVNPCPIVLTDDLHLLLLELFDVLMVAVGKESETHLSLLSDGPRKMFVIISGRLLFITVNVSESSIDAADARQLDRLMWHKAKLDRVFHVRVAFVLGLEDRLIRCTDHMVWQRGFGADKAV